MVVRNELNAPTRDITKISSCCVKYNKLAGNQTARDFFWFHFSSIFQ